MKQAQGTKNDSARTSQHPALDEEILNGLQEDDGDALEKEIPYYMKFWRHFNLANLAIFFLRNC